VGGEDMGKKKGGKDKGNERELGSECCGVQKSLK